MSEGIDLIRLSESYSDIEVVEAPTDRTEWLKERQKGIGGSDAGAICGVDKHRDALDVYLDKIGEGAEREETQHTKRGRKLEQIVAEEYLERHQEDELIPCKPMIHPYHGWMRGNPDRIINAPRHTTKGLGVLEIKVPSRHVYDRIRLEGVPANYILQMQHYLAVANLNWGCFAIFNADKWELLLVEVERDEQVIRSMIALEEKFWNDNVVPRKPPKRGKKTERIVLPKTDGQVKDKRADSGFTDWLTVYEQALVGVKSAEEYAETAKQKLIDYIHKEPGVYQTKDRRIYYTRVEGRKSFDKKALANAKPVDRLALALRLDDHTYSIGDIAESLASGRLDLNLADFETKGNDFTTLRIFPAKPEEE